MFLLLIFCDVLENKLLMTRTMNHGVQYPSGSVSDSAEYI